MTVGGNYLRNNVAKNGKAFANDIFILTLQSVFFFVWIKLSSRYTKTTERFFWD